MFEAHAQVKYERSRLAHTHVIGKDGRNSPRDFRRLTDTFKRHSAQTRNGRTCADKSLAYSWQDFVLKYAQHFAQIWNILFHLKFSQWSTLLRRIKRCFTHSSLISLPSLRVLRPSSCVTLPAGLLTPTMSKTLHSEFYSEPLVPHTRRVK